MADVRVAGGHTGLADFRHGVHRFRPLEAQRIVADEVVGHSTDKQLVALARKRFVKFDRFAGPFKRCRRRHLDRLAPGVGRH